MRILIAFALLICTALPLWAQDDAAADDKTFLEGWLQDALSDAGRQVTITGFQGALSSEATLQQLTIADAEGPWFILREARLKWSRSALLRGRLQVDELIAGSISILRRPAGEDGITPEDAQAYTFALPELPVSVNVGALRAERIELSEAVIGEPATLSLTGAFRLEEGEGEGTLDIIRQDRDDVLRFTGSFSNATRVLSLDLDLREAAGGLISQVAGIPGAPALRLQVQGDAPLSDFIAQIALSSDGRPRLSGTVELAAEPDETGGGHIFKADLGGDLRPLFQPEFHAFFGQNAGLLAEGRSWPDGRLSLTQFALNAEAMELNGQLELTAERWPERFRLSGQIGRGDGITRLPFGGRGARLNIAQLSATYDAAAGDSWQAKLDIDGFENAQLRSDDLRLAATGRLARGQAEAVTANIAFDTTGLRHADPALSQAIGPAPNGTLRLSWRPGAPLDIAFLSLKSGDLSLTASGQIDELATGLPITGQATLNAGDLTRFAALTGRPLAGVARASLRGDGALLGGRFDIELEAATEALEVGIARLTPLLRPPSTLTLKARRDETGTRLDRLEVENDAASLSASGQLNATSGDLNLSARLTEIALVDTRLSGPGTAQAELAWQADGPVTLSGLTATGMGLSLSGNGRIWPEDPALPAEGQLTLKSEDLSRLAPVIGRPVRGALDLDLEGRAELAGQTLSLSGGLTGTELRTGLAELDRLIAGNVQLDAAVALTDTALDLQYLKLAAPRLRANATGTGPGAPIAISVRLPDLGVLAPGFSGAATARGELRLQDRLARRVDLSVDATGPGGTTARIGGTVRDYGQSMSLGLTGRAPLGLVNRFIAPRSVEGDAAFDLRLEGAPALDALSGRVTLSGGRVSLPKFKAALSGVDGTVTLANGRAETDIGGTLGTGGSLRLQGPVTLRPPYPADLRLSLVSLGLSDPTLYRTTADGTLTIEGPLTGGAGIGGEITLGRTELRVPSGGGVNLGSIPSIRHVNEPADVAATRRRAGLTETAAGPGISFPLDLTIRAPNQIFVRGRGLDAELGGQVRLGGTTANVTASGFFELIRGRLDILGRRIELTRGLIDLRGALDPYIEFVAETRSDDILVRVILEGLASNPSVRFESEPDLPQEEAVARLLFRRGLDSISPLQAAELVAAAATLSGQRSGGLTGGLRAALGLSDLDIAEGEDGATELRIGAYLSENIYSQVTADSEGRQEINLNLDLTPSITIKGRADTAGDTGIGIFFEKDY